MVKAAVAGKERQTFQVRGSACGGIHTNANVVPARGAAQGIRKCKA